MSPDAILIFVVAYNAETHIAATLDRIDRSWLKEQQYQILIIDDASTDRTTQICKDYQSEHPDLKMLVLRNEENLGYGGNQKRGYQYAIDNNFGLVVLLHGDGQYAPEYLEQMTHPLVTELVGCVLGSRMLNKSAALEGNMPMYKWIGNQILTTMQNVMLGTSLAEFHTGYRAFRVSSLKAIPFIENSDYFDFDTEIIIQLIDTDATFKEIAIPTFYGDEISYVNGFKYAWLIIWATLKSRLVKRKWLSDRRFKY